MPVTVPEPVPVPVLICFNLGKESRTVCLAEKSLPRDIHARNVHDQHDLHHGKRGHGRVHHDHPGEDLAWGDEDVLEALGEETSDIFLSSSPIKKSKKSNQSSTRIKLIKVELILALPLGEASLKNWQNMGQCWGFKFLIRLGEGEHLQKSIKLKNVSYIQDVRGEAYLGHCPIFLSF